MPVPQPGQGNGPALQSATVATFSLGTLPAGTGIQGIALSNDRTRLYLGNGWATTTYNPTLRMCQGTPSPPPQGASGGVVILDTTANGAMLGRVTTIGWPIHAETDAATGRVYVALSPGGISVIEGVRQVASLPLGGVPHDIGIDSRLGMAFATNTVGADPASQRFVTQLNLATNTKLRDVDTGGVGPHKAAVDPERHLAYISHAEFNKVTVMDTNTGALLRYIETGLLTGGAQNAIDLARRRLYVVGRNSIPTESVVRVIDLETERVLPMSLSIPGGGHGMRVDPVTGYLWVVLESNASVSVIATDTLTEITRLETGTCPYYLDIDPVRRLAFVSNQGDSTVSVLDMSAVASPAQGMRRPQ